MASANAVTRLARKGYPVHSGPERGCARMPAEPGLRHADRTSDGALPAPTRSERPVPAMDPLQLLDTAQDRAAAAVAQVRADQLAWPTPCAGWDVRTCLNKLVTSTRYWVVSLTEGRDDPMLDLGNPPALIGDDPLGVYRAAATACRAAFDQDGILTTIMPAPVPGLVLTGEQMLGVRIFDTTVITWDLARSIGAPHGIDAAQADFAHAVAGVVIPLVAGASDRQRFQAGADPNSFADPVERLVAATGRDPHWQAP